MKAIEPSLLIRCGMRLPALMRWAITAILVAGIVALWYLLIFAPLRTERLRLERELAAILPSPVPQKPVPCWHTAFRSQCRELARLGLVIEEYREEDQALKRDFGSEEGSGINARQNVLKISGPYHALVAWLRNLEAEESVAIKRLEIERIEKDQVRLTLMFKQA